LALAAALGFRHGLDPDHIAVVDNMTRVRQLQGFWNSRFVGAQFALGHGAVIVAASMLLHMVGATLPGWLNETGVVISTSFLLMTGASSLAYALRRTGTVPHAHGLLSRAFAAMTGSKLHPALIGMAFAFSMDAIAQAAFFAARGTELSGGVGVVLLATSFGCGMLVADAANGALLNWFTSQIDRLDGGASRISSAFIALTAFVALVVEFRPQSGGGSDGKDTLVGVCLVAVIFFAYSVRIFAQRTWR
jgi:high-affinity nickel-transport protein